MDEQITKHKTIIAYSADEFDKQLNTFEDELRDQGFKSIAAQTHVARLTPREQGEDDLLFFAHIFYKAPDMAGKKLCPSCGGIIPEKSKEHLRCGWKGE